MSHDAFTLIESAESAAEPETKRALLKEAIAMLSTMDLQSADVAYALGYAWYLIPDQTQERDSETLKHLTAAVRLSPTHVYARLYLAHFYFDTGECALAMPLLESFAPTEFSARDQEWRDVKVAELILSCKLELRETSGILDCLQQLLARANRADAESLPIPAELTEVLTKLIRASLTR